MSEPETPAADPADAAEQTPVNEAKAELTPLQSAKIAREKVALELAVRAVDEPLFPRLGQRCGRCGERLPRPLKGEEGADDHLPDTKVAKSLATDCARCGVVLRSAAAGKQLVPTRGALREFFRGILYLPRGLFRLMTSPSLWLLSTVPLLLNIGALVLGWYMANELVEPWVEGKIVTWEQAGGAWAYMTWSLRVLDWAFAILIFPVVAFLIVCPGFNIPYKLVFMPIMEFMTEATEQLVLGFKDDGGFDPGRLFGNLVVGIIDAILLTLGQVIIMILLLPFNLIPVLGTLFWAFCMPAAFASMDYTDINLVRRGYTTKEKFRLWRAYQWRFFGYGSAFFFFLTIPLINAFVIPAAAVGGALLYLELERK